MKFGFTTLFTDKFEESVALYRDVLGFEIYKEFSPSPGISIAFLKNDSNKIEILQNEHSPAVDNSKSAIQLTFLVEDINETHAYIKNTGVRSVSEIISLPSGLQMFHGKDPNDITLGFVKET